MGIGILGRRQVTPRWANDTVWLHVRSRRESDQGRVRAPLPDGNKVEGGGGRIQTTERTETLEQMSGKRDK